MAIESFCYIEGNKMFRQLFKAIVVARQASVSASAMRYISDCQFKELGYERSNYVEKVKWNSGIIHIDYRFVLVIKWRNMHKYFPLVSRWTGVLGQECF